MRLPWKMKWIVACAFLAYAATPAGAQPQPQGGAPANPADSQNLVFQRGVALTPAQQLAAASAYISSDSQAHDTVQHSLQQARQQRDVVKVLCLNDKLNQIDVALRSLQDRQKALASAYGNQQPGAHQDTDLGRHEFTLITVLHQRVQQLMKEAEACIGQESSYTGTTTTYVTIDNNQAGGEQTGFNPIGAPPTPPIEVGPPTYSAPPPPCSPAK